MTLTRWLIVALAAAALAHGIRSVAASEDPTGAAVAITQPGNADETSRLIAVFEARLEEDQTYPDLATLGGLYLTRARTSGLLDDHVTALDIWERAAALAPDSPDALVGLAQAEISVHRFIAAADHAAKALESDPTNAGATIVVVDAALANGDSAQAASGLDRLSAVAGDDPAVLVRRAQLEWLTGDPESALLLAESADRGSSNLGLDPSTAAVFTAHRAGLLNDTGRYADVLELIPDDSGHPPLAFQRARALMGVGDLDSAVEALETLVLERPDPQFLAQLGRLLLATGDTRKLGGVDATIEALQALDESGVYARPLATWMVDRGLDPAVALELAERDDRDDPGGHDARAWALYANGRHEEARTEADAALASGVTDPLIAYHSGEIWMALGELDEARADFEQALDWSPGFDALHVARTHELLRRIQG